MRKWYMLENSEASTPEDDPGAKTGMLQKGAEMLSIAFPGRDSHKHKSYSQVISSGLGKGWL